MYLRMTDVPAVFVLSAAAVDDVWMELLSSSPAVVDGMIGRFREAQPGLAGFVFAAEESVFANDERGSLVLYSLWSWLVCRRAGRAGREVTEEMIEGALGANSTLLHSAAAAPPNDVMSTASAWTADYPGLPLLSAILNQVMGGELENPRHVDDFAGLIMLYMKTVIDCLLLE
jgi:hypothetical protein